MWCVSTASVCQETVPAITPWHGTAKAVPRVRARISSRSRTSAPRERGHADTRRQVGTRALCDNRVHDQPPRRARHRPRRPHRRRDAHSSRRPLRPAGPGPAPRAAGRAPGSGVGVRVLHGERPCAGGAAEGSQGSPRRPLATFCRLARADDGRMTLTPTPRCGRVDRLGTARYTAASAPRALTGEAYIRRSLKPMREHQYEPLPRLARGQV